MSTNDSGGFWSALFNVSKDDKIMIWLLRIILLVITISLLISLPIYFWDRANNRASSQLFGLLTFQPDKINYSEKNNNSSFLNKKSEIKEQDSSIKPLTNKNDIGKKEGNSNLTKKDPTLKKDSSNNSKYNLQSTTFNAPAIIGDNNTQNNFGELPRIIYPADFNSFFTQVPNKNVRIQVDFIGLSATKEMINVKSQIFKILSDNGYNNLERLSGYRLLKEEISKIAIYKESDEKYIFFVPPK